MDLLDRMRASLNRLPFVRPSLVAQQRQEQPALVSTELDPPVWDVTAGAFVERLTTATEMPVTERNTLELQPDASRPLIQREDENEREMP